MPALLNYEIVTDPTSLQVSSDGVPSVGTVYVIASNTHQAPVKWEYIDVEIPVGKDPEHLTEDPAAITASISKTGARKWRVAPTFAREGEARFRAKDPYDEPVTLRREEALILKLENIPVSGKEGLVCLTIHEKSEGGDSVAAERSGHYTTILGVAKQSSKAPRNFRAESSLLDVDAGDSLVLRWDGPSNLDYWVLDATGTEVHYAPASRAGVVTQEGYSPYVEAPKRGTTYTLVAAAADAGQARAGYFLTTTVHARIPEFESGTRTLWVEGTAAKGRVAFAEDGVAVQKVGSEGHVPGRVAADSADVQSVKTVLVRGRGDADGWIDFPESGVEVFHGPGRDLGTVDADTVKARQVRGRNEADGGIDFPERGVNVFHGPQQEAGALIARQADVDSVKTKWVQGRTDSAGWIDFPDTGIEVFHGPNRDLGTVDADTVKARQVRGRNEADGGIGFPESGVNVFHGPQQEAGTVTAHRADVTGVNTAWVQGRDGGAGWIEFPAAGLNVFQGAGNRQWGTVAAGKADLDDLVTARALVKERLTVQGGLTVGDVLETQEGPSRLIVHGRLEAEEEVSAHRRLSVGGDLSTNGDLTVHGDVHPLRNLEVGGDLTVHGDVRPLRNLEVGGTVSASDLTVGGKLTTTGEYALTVHGAAVFDGKVNANQHLSVRGDGGWVIHTNDEKVAVHANFWVSGESLFHGKVNANKHLSVRNEGVGWILHTGDDKVAIQADLRVHGNLHADS
ncbi:hypothetical protein ACFVFS_37525 [Kitasatospora sp. NPDC057692]|uniref:hypothetical protein n=1 Tax=Kitasatospora sp. NPDC057692 TaxID=3346215 RepID=UPI0036769E86